jgi:hypothetical protein
MNYILTASSTNTVPVDVTFDSVISNTLDVTTDIECKDLTASATVQGLTLTSTGNGSVNGDFEAGRYKTNVVDAYQQWYNVTASSGASGFTSAKWAGVANVGGAETAVGALLTITLTLSQLVEDDHLLKIQIIEQNNLTAGACFVLRNILLTTGSATVTFQNVGTATSGTSYNIGLIWEVFQYVLGA